jgi:hypothetical protein
MIVIARLEANREEVVRTTLLTTGDGGRITSPRPLCSSMYVVDLPVLLVSCAMWCWLEL